VDLRGRAPELALNRAQGDRDRRLIEKISEFAALAAVSTPRC
jgi:hypothetical protein